MTPLTIAIDFDGTIVRENYPEMGEVIPGAVEFINSLYDLGTALPVKKLENIIAVTCPEAKKKFFFTHTFDNYDLPHCFDSIDEAIAAAKEEMSLWNEDIMPDPDEAEAFRIIDYDGNEVYRLEGFAEEEMRNNPVLGDFEYGQWHLIKVEEAGV